MLDFLYRYAATSLMETLKIPTAEILLDELMLDNIRLRIKLLRYPIPGQKRF